MPYKYWLSIVIVFIHVSTESSLFSQEIISRSALTIGESLNFQSKILNESRILNVYLPVNYQVDTAKNYPVIYLLDGSIEEDFIHISGLVQFATFPWVKMIEESIVVGIGNIDRQRDFTQPSTNTEDIETLPSNGGSANFISCLKTEILPTIESRFRATKSKSIIGQSLGGLVATEILLFQPQLFDNYIIISPSLWWDNQSFLKREASVNFIKQPKNIYIAVGNEGQEMEETSRTLYQKLVDLENPYLHIKFKYFQSQNHGNILHLAAHDALNQLFDQSEESKSSVSDKEAIINLIRNTFVEILSNHDSTKLSNYLTDDFLLLEDGVEWTLDTVKSYLRKANIATNKPIRENKFEFIKLNIQGSMAWVAYKNWATFIINGEVIRKMHWLESAVVVDTPDGWKIQQLHSTVVNKE